MSVSRDARCLQYPKSLSPRAGQSMTKKSIMNSRRCSWCRKTFGRIVQGAAATTRARAHHAFDSPERIRMSRMSRGGTKWKLLSKTAGPESGARVPARRFRWAIYFETCRRTRGTRTWARSRARRDTFARTTNLSAAAVRRLVDVARNLLSSAATSVNGNSNRRGKKCENKWFTRYRR